MVKVSEIKSLSRAVIGAAFNMHASNVNKWSEKGCPRNNDGTYDLSAVIEWRIEDLGMANGAACESPEAQKWLTAFRRERALLAEIERKKVEKKLIRVEEMTREWGKRLHTLFSGIRLWTHRLTPRLESKTKDEMRKIFEEETYTLQLQFLKKGRYCPSINGFASPDEPDRVKK
jgi:phage terminase Nu1 subunit (DNA packaging protein)